MRVFELPEEFLQGKLLSSTLAIPITTQSSPTDIHAHSSAKQKTSTITTKLGCAQCSVYAFESLVEQRQHFQSPWHLHNLALKRRQKPPVTLTEFNECDGESLEGSDDDDYSSNGSDEIIDSDNDEKSMEEYIYWKLDSKCLRIHKACLPVTLQREDENAIQQSLLALQINAIKDTTPYWTILMISGGHFAGAVFDNCKDGIMVKHSAFHRYVSRRKQGGTQATKDQQGRKAKSAGATLRRYNQQQLEQSVQVLIESWQPLLQQSQFIYVHAPGQLNKNIIFGGNNGTPLDSKMTRNIPFTTHRPTLKELQRVYNRITTVLY